MIDKAAHQGVGHQPGSWHATVNDLWLGGLLYQELATPAGPLAVDVPMHEELGGHDVQPFADVFAHTLHGLAARWCRAGGALWLVVVHNATQVIGQGLAPRCAFGGIAGGCVARCDLALEGLNLGLQRSLVFGQRVFEDLALLGVHALGLGTEAPGLVAGQLKGQLLHP